ncbi:hypothetical protein HPB50_023404 [Hyalomma asiaticum]|uniref:Uncharacterized protein n=1 Tax=Hyalomma asiaticum TaxID=266040 RepID=A0ACB7S576_HYAAI|nr:hypothetical protein HPB50_023404 [Hyalomma asiaticum]
MSPRARGSGDASRSLAGTTRAETQRGHAAKEVKCAQKEPREAVAPRPIDPVSDNDVVKIYAAVIFGRSLVAGGDASAIIYSSASSVFGERARAYYVFGHILCAAAAEPGGLPERPHDAEFA